MTTELMVPCKFDLNLLTKYAELNGVYSYKEPLGNDIIISSQFGSSPYYDPIGSSRESSRLPNITHEHLKDYIHTSNCLNIPMNWTMNASCIGTLENLDKLEDALYYSIGNLVDLGINIFTIAHPLIIEIVRNKFPKIIIEASTIMHVESIEQIKQLIDMKVDKICISLNMNRNFDFLRQAAKLPIIIELLATEFCNIYCLHRRFHYVLQTHQHKTENEYFCNYPYSRCSLLKSNDIVNWIKAPFILPQWLKDYEEIGINNFKITGRTFPSEKIYPVVESYMKRNYSGNIINLWTPLENIGGKEHEIINNTAYIDADSLDSFINIFKHGNIDCRLCSNEYCNHCYCYIENSSYYKESQ